MNNCFRYDCPNLNQVTNQCNISACIYNHNKYDYEQSTVLRFPHTIGYITFQTVDELIDWVNKQQIKNKEILNILLKEG